MYEYVPGTSTSVPFSYQLAEDMAHVGVQQTAERRLNLGDVTLVGLLHHVEARVRQAEALDLLEAAGNLRWPDHHHHHHQTIIKATKKGKAGKPTAANPKRGEGGGGGGTEQRRRARR